MDWIPAGQATIKGGITVLDGLSGPEVPKV